MINVVDKLQRPEITVNEITDTYFEGCNYGIWFVNKKDYSCKLLKLSKSYGPERYFLTKFNGLHGGWGDGPDLKSYLNNVFINFDIFIPETKSEMIQLITKYAN